MNGTDTTNAKAAANSIVPLYDPAVQWLGLGTLGPSTPSGGCATAPGQLDRDRDRAGRPATLGPRGPQRHGLDVQHDLREGEFGDQLLHELGHRHGPRRPGHDGRLRAASTTDGPASARGSSSRRTASRTTPSPAAPTTATCPAMRRPPRRPSASRSSRSASGSTAASGGDPSCPDTSGAWKGKTATGLLASMATGPVVGTTTCSAAENTDDDHFYCIGKTGASTDLSGIFKAAAASLAKGGSRLVQLYPVPILTSVAPSTGQAAGGTSVAIVGRLLHGRNVRHVRGRTGHLQRGERTARSRPPRRPARSVGPSTSWSRRPVARPR